MPGSDDELISEYVDGRLDPDARAAFEARLREDQALRRRAEATRLLVGAARALPPARLPRNFVVPVAQPARRQAPRGAWAWRLGSAFAAVVFVFALALDLSLVMPSAPLAPQSAAVRTESAAAPAQAPQPASAPAADVAVVTETVVVKEAGRAEDAPEVAPEVAPAAAPEEALEEAPAAAGAAAPAAAPTEAPAELAAANTEPEPTSSAMGAASLPASESMPSATPAPAAKAQAEQPAPQATSAPTATRAPAASPSPAATQPTFNAPAGLNQLQPTPEPNASPWLRLVAVGALLAAILLAVAGWRRA
jgi:hypothetical protein